MPTYNDIHKGTVQSSYRSTANKQYREKTDFEVTIERIEPRKTKFLTLLSSVPTEKADQCKFTNLFDRPIPTVTKVAVAAAYNATSLTLANTEWVIPKMTFINSRTKEQVYVTAVSGSVVTVLRGMGTSAYAMLPGDKMNYIAIAQEEGASKVSSTWRDTEKADGYCQKFEQNLSLTDVEVLKSYNGISELNRTTADRVDQFKQQKERAFVLGKPYSTSLSNGRELYFTGGVLDYCGRYNNFDMGKCASVAALRRALESIAEYGITDPILVMSNRLSGEFSNMKEFKDSIRTTRAEDTVGANLRKIQSLAGIATIVECSAMDREGYNDEIAVVDMAYFKTKVFEPTTTREINTDSGDHVKESQMFERSGLKCKKPAALGRIFNVGIAQ